MDAFPSHINSREDVLNLLTGEATHDQALAYLQALMDERYQFGPDWVWGVVEPNGLTRLGLEVAEAVEMGAIDRVVNEPEGPSVDGILAAKSASLQAEKCRARDAGFLVEGVRFDSDQAARTSYLELSDLLAADPLYSTPWKASPGAWVVMNASLYAKVKAAGAAHISACFAWQAARDAELAAIQAAVAGGTMSTAAARAAIEAVPATYEAMS